MLRAVVCLVLSAFGSEALAASGQVLRSPDGRIELRVGTAGRLRFSVRLAGKLLVDDATLSLDVDHAVLGVRAQGPLRADRAGRPRGRGARAPGGREDPRALRTSCASRWTAATRSCSAPTTTASLTGSRRRSRRPEVKVYAEEAGFPSRATNRVYFPKEDGFFSHNERKYAFGPLKDDRARAPSPSLPAVVGDRRRDQDRGRGVGRRRLPGAVARGHGRQRARRDLPAVPARGEAGAGPRHQGRPHRRLHRRDARDAQPTPGASWASPRRTPTC